MSDEEGARLFGASLPDKKTKKEHLNMIESIVNEEIIAAIEEVFGEGFEWMGDFKFYPGETIKSLKAEYEANVDEEDRDWDGVLEHLTQLPQGVLQTA